MGVAKVYPHSKVHGPLKYSIQRRIRSNAPVLLIMGATCCTLLWLGQLLGQLLSPLPRPLPAMPHSPREIVQHSYHAIIVPAGGQLDVDGPPPHVAARLELAAKLYKVAPSPKPFVITTAWGTPHKACPHDAAGFERHEAADNAAALLALGVSPAHVLEESVSLETVGNAYFTRLLHTDVRGLQRLVVINNRFHMPRTRAVFDHVFALPLLEGMPHANYDLEYIEVDDRLDPEVLEARLVKEARALPKFEAGGSWRKATPTLRELHQWMHEENTAYATKRLLHARVPLDPELLKSY